MKKWWLGLLAGVGLAALMVAPVRAGVNDFVIEEFSAEYTLSKADKQGELKVTERIDVTFSDNNHGILRAIPSRYKNHRLQLQIEKVSSASGAPAQYTTYSSNGNTVLKIGDPDRTVTGRQSYVIAYTVRNVIGFYPEHDELYWDINGDQWGQPAKKVSLTLRLPKGLTPNDQQLICYTGAFGSTEQVCEAKYEAGTVTAQTLQALGPNEGLTILIGFPKGYFTPSAWHETLGEYGGTIAAFLVPLLLLGGTAGLYWFRHGRDPKGRGVIVPQYDAPDGLGPLGVGTLADFRTDNRDITATVIDLAIRGYLKIIEITKPRKFRKDLKTYSLRLERTDLSDLNEEEQELIRGLFAEQAVGKEVELSTLEYKLNKTANQLRQQAHRRLVDSGYLRKHSWSVTLRFWSAIVAAGVIGLVMAVLFGVPSVVGLIFGGVVVVIFLVLLPARTPRGVAAKEHVLGLKQYLAVAEAERIKKLQSPDAPYAPRSAEPKKTVELFEKLLPYAMVLGVEAQWAKQFERIYRTPPDWYQGHRTGFSAVYLASALGSGVQSSVNAAFSSPSSSSGSGFSGGGAGGGGGGGGW